VMGGGPFGEHFFYPCNPIEHLFHQLACSHRPSRINVKPLINRPWIMRCCFLLTLGFVLLLRRLLGVELWVWWARWCRRDFLERENSVKQRVCDCDHSRWYILEGYGAAFRGPIMCYRGLDIHHISQKFRIFLTISRDISVS